MIMERKFLRKETAYPCCQYQTEEQNAQGIDGMAEEIVIRWSNPISTIIKPVPIKAKYSVPQVATARPTSLSAERNGTMIAAMTNINEIKNRTSNVIVATRFPCLMPPPCGPLASIVFA